LEVHADTLLHDCSAWRAKPLTQPAERNSADRLSAIRIDCGRSDDYGAVKQGLPVIVTSAV
jgi:hypothetical protein